MVPWPMEYIRFLWLIALAIGYNTINIPDIINLGVHGFMSLTVVKLLQK